MNKEKFNLQPYNRQGETSKKLYVGKNKLGYKLNGILASNKTISIKNKLEYKLDCTGSLGMLLKVISGVNYELNSDIKYNFNICTHNKLNYILDTNIDYAKSIFIKNKVDYNIDTNIVQGKLIKFNNKVDYEQIGEVILGKRFYLGKNSLPYEMIGQLEIYNYIYEDMILDVVIPPGGILTINSDIFEVILNGENAIHTHRGDWIFNRPDLEEISLSIWSGKDHKTNLIYTERFI